MRSVLGEGGMGTVFDAVHVAIGRPVAIKLLRPSHARRAASVLRFHREATAVARIGHPNVCEIYDLDALEDGRPYLVMERLVGETLGDRIAARGRLPYDLAIAIVDQALSALAAAHDRGIVHRDIKPDNVFLTSRIGGALVVKLLDFGVSKAIGPARNGDDPDLTGRGMVMGTPHYMAPEQARGDRDLDARIDVYACGVVLYEALTGRRPFGAAEPEALLRDVLSLDPRPMRELRPTLPRAFEPVLRKAMARRPDDRYGSALEFRGALRALGEQLRRPWLVTTSVPPGERTAEARPAGKPALGPHVDTHPTRVWLRGNALAPFSSDEGAPTLVMVRPERGPFVSRPGPRGR